MPAPTKEEIRRRALEMWYVVPEHVGLPPPEEDELKERNIWREAQIGLMRTWGVEIGEMIARGIRRPTVATRQYLEYLRSEMDELEKMIKELKAAPRRRRRVVEELKTRGIREDIARKEEALTLLLEREPLLDRAYAGEPMVLSWLKARDMTVEDLESEVQYLRGIVGDPQEQQFQRCWDCRYYDRWGRFCEYHRVEMYPESRCVKWEPIPLPRRGSSIHGLL